MTITSVLLLGGLAALAITILWSVFKMVKQSIQEIREVAAPRPRLLLAVVLGLAGSVLFTSVSLFMLRVMVLWFIAFSLGAVLFTPLFLGAWITKHAVRWAWLPNLRRSALLGLAALLLPACALAPWAPQFLLLKGEARRMVPSYPGVEPSRVRVEWGDGENFSDRIRMSFPAAADSTSILRFYLTELNRRGWTEDTTVARGTASGSTTAAFRMGFKGIRLTLGEPGAAGLVPYEVQYRP